MDNKLPEVSKNDFWKKFKCNSQNSLRAIYRSYPAGSLDEQGIPAYLHPNPLARWLFWKRLQVCFQEILEMQGERCLDFGCGSGIMLPILSQKFQEVIGVDIVPQVTKQHLNKMEQYGWVNKQNISILPSLENLSHPDNSFDLILALDVLEHVEDLDEVLGLFDSGLKRSGVLLVSGPTENTLYKLGRAITGAGYSVYYHVRSIYDIQQAMRNYFDVRVIRQLVFPLTLFLMLKAIKK
jgi:2-polyprenyl-3-methyl-5-hydroxy-6-metoxy-1,4-benzoquinol methylase